MVAPSRQLAGRGTGWPSLLFVAMPALSGPLKWARLSELARERRIASEKEARTVGARPLCERRITNNHTFAANRGPARHPLTGLGWTVLSHPPVLLAASISLPLPLS